MTDYIAKINNILCGGKGFDGSVVMMTTSPIIASGNLETKGVLTISLSEQLPNDGCDYEICVCGNCTVSTNGQWGNISAVSGTVDSTFTSSGNYDKGQVLFVRRARTGNAYYSAHTNWIPIPANDRNMTICNFGNGTTSYTIYFCGYRRVGTTNQSGIDYVKKINTYPIGGDNFDGQWVMSPYTCAAGVQYLQKTATTYSLDNYLPDDGKDYMVSFSGYGNTPSGSGACTIRLSNGTKTLDETLDENKYFFREVYHSTSYSICAGNMLLPIFANDKNVTISNNSANDTGSCGLMAVAYRRLGKNE